MSDEDDDDDDINPCGYSYDHDIDEVIEGHWTCRRCGAEGWDDDE